MFAGRAIDTVLVKTASRCNLDCSYCYVYHMDDDGWRSQPKRMSLAVIDATITQLGELSFQQERPLSVVLHGGEPLMLGLSAMTRLVKGLRGTLRNDAGLHIQTNGLLLTDRFIELFAANDVGISISLDGPAPIHDTKRVDHRGRGSYDRVAASIAKLRAHAAGPRLFSGILAVIDPASSPRAVYDALKDTGAPGFDLLVRDGNHDRLPQGKASHGSTEFGSWMTGLLACYLADPTPPRIRVLDDLMRLVLGGEGRKEGVGLTDFGILVVETDGTLTKNDTLKVAHDGADRFGASWSVLHHNLSEVLYAEEVGSYHDLQRPTATACLACPELSVCGGGMPAHRWSDARGYDNPTIYCADQKLLIAHLRQHIAAAKAVRSAA